MDVLLVVVYVVVAALMAVAFVADGPVRAALFVAAAVTALVPPYCALSGRCFSSRDRERRPWP